MQNFLRLTKQAIDRHGVSVIFKKVSNPVYDYSTGQAVSTEINYTVKVYPRHIVANQYNFPNMLNKEIIDFYLFAPDLRGVQPAVNDKVNFESADWTVVRLKGHRTNSDVALYVITAVKT